jgi:hypothetical protein
VKNCAPNPAVHGEKSIDGPEAHVFIIGALGLQRKLVKYKHQKRGEPLKVHKQV